MLEALPSPPRRLRQIANFVNLKLQLRCFWDARLSRHSCKQIKAPPCSSINFNKLHGRNVVNWQKTSGRLHAEWGSQWSRHLNTALKQNQHSWDVWKNPCSDSCLYQELVSVLALAKYDALQFGSAAESRASISAFCQAPWRGKTWSQAAKGPWWGQGLTFFLWLLFYGMDFQTQHTFAHKTSN